MHSILLVNPPSPFLLDDRTFPALGILTVAAEVRKLGHEVTLLDLAGHADYLERAARFSSTWDGDIVGLTANTPQMPYAAKLYGLLKEHLPNKHFIIGGPHASFAPKHCLELGLDQVVLDDGVDGIRKVLSDDSRPLINGGLIPLDDYPLPSRDLIDMDSYHYILPGTDLNATNVMWSQGCPYRCSFCSGRELFYYRKYRTRSPEHILWELDALRDQYGLNAFQAYDDEVNIQNEWLKRVCEVLASRNYKWRAFIKANLFNDEIAADMARAGCVEVCTGVESGSDRILKEVIQKETTYAINLEARRVAGRHGIRFKAFCMVGNPSETLDEIMLTKQWILEARPDEFDITILSPMPGSPIYDRKFPGKVRQDFVINSFPKFELEFSDRNFASEDSYYKTVPHEFQAWTSTPTLSSHDLERLRDDIDTEVRADLGLPQLSREVSPFEHSMGQSSPKGST